MNRFDLNQSPCALSTAGWARGAPCVHSPAPYSPTPQPAERPPRRPDPQPRTDGAAGPTDAPRQPRGHDTHTTPFSIPWPTRGEGISQTSRPDPPGARVA